MAKQSYGDKLASAPPAAVYVLDETKAARLKAATMYIPAPAEVAGMIAASPPGETRTQRDLRAEFQAQGLAQTVCPASINKYWRWLAWASDEEGGDGDGEQRRPPEADRAGQVDVGGGEGLDPVGGDLDRGQGLNLF